MFKHGTSTQIPMPCDMSTADCPDCESCPAQASVHEEPWRCVGACAATTTQAGTQGLCSCPPSSSEPSKGLVLHSETLAAENWSQPCKPCRSHRYGCTSFFLLLHTAFGVNAGAIQCNAPSLPALPHFLQATLKPGDFVHRLLGKCGSVASSVQVAGSIKERFANSALICNSLACGFVVLQSLTACQSKESLTIPFRR